MLAPWTRFAPPSPAAATDFPAWSWPSSRVTHSSIARERQGPSDDPSTALPSDVPEGRGCHDRPAVAGGDAAARGGRLAAGRPEPLAGRLYTQRRPHALLGARPDRDGLRPLADA